MKTTVLIIVLFFSFNLYCQERTNDKIVLNNGSIMFGKIEKIKTDAVEF